VRGFLGLPSIIWIIIAFVIIVVAGSNLVGIANLIASLTAETVGGCEVKSGLAIIPLIGYYKCEIMGEVCDYIEIPYISGLNPLEKFTTCCDISTTSCEYTIQRKDGTNLASAGSMDRGYCVEVYKDTVLTGDRRLKRCYHPYTLVRYSPTSAPERVYGQTKFSCTLPSTNNLLQEIPLYFQGTRTDVNLKSTLAFDETTPFLDNWVVGPVEYKLQEGKYCSAGGSLYPTQSIKLVAGCFVAPNLNEQPTKVDCCNGETAGTKTCVNFKWVDVSEAECDVLRPCPTFGKYYVDRYKDPSGKTAYTLICTEGKCVPQYVVSECSSSQACPSDKPVCDFNTLTGIGKCISSGTPVIPPRPDIPPKPGFDIVGWLKNYLIAFVISLIVLGVMVHILPFVLPIFNVLKPLRNIKLLLVAAALLALLIMLLFATPIGNIAAGVFK